MTEKVRISVLSNMIFILLSLSFLSAAEFLIDTSRVIMSEPRNQNHPAVAFDGANYLTVWSDQRLIGTADIFGTRVDQNGNVLDQGGLIICNSGGAQQDPSVAFSGTNYFVAWSDSRSGMDEIYGARVTPGGDVLDPGGILISSTNGDRWSPDVASDGTDFMVVWVDTRNGAEDLYGARVDQSGIVLDPGGIPVSTAPSYQEPPHIAFGTTDYLVVWEDYRDPGGYADFYGTRISPAGVVLDPSGIAITSTPLDDDLFGDVAFDGVNWFAVWMNLTTEEQMFGARINPAGVVLDPNGFPISAPGSNISYSSVGFDGSNFLVAWEQRTVTDNIYGARVSPGGVVLDPASLPIVTVDEEQSLPSVAGGPNGFFVAWQDERENGFLPDIFGARVSQNGAILDPDGFELSFTTNNQTNPAVSSNGADYLVVWEDNRVAPDTTKIFIRRFTPNGAPLDPGPVAISNTPGIQSRPCTVWDEANYLVFWQDYRSGSGKPDIYAARILPDGTNLDPGGFPLAASGNGDYNPAAAFDGQNTLVAYSRRVGSYYHIYGARVTPQGTVLDPAGIQIITANTNHFNPAVIFADSLFLIVYERQGSGSYSEDIYGVRMKTDATISGPNGFPVCNVSGSRQREPAVSYNGQNFMVVWKDERHDRFNPDIYGGRVTLDGSILDPGGFVICRAAGIQETPDIITNAGESLVLWGDGRNGDLDLHGVRLDNTGAITDSFTVASGLSNQSRPSLANGSGTQLLIAFEGWAGTVNGITYNSNRAWGTFRGTSTGIGKQDDPLLSGFQLFQNYPNPFNPVTTITYRIPKSGRVSLKIFDVLGREVATLVNQQQTAGEYRVQWDGGNFPSSIYFYQLTADDFLEIRKMVLLK